MQKLYHYIKQVGNYARIPKKIIPIIFSFLLAFQPFVLKAQQYPVKMVPVLLPPYSLKLSEYATSTQTKLRLQVMMTDLQEPQHPTGIKFSLESSLGAVPIATSQSFVSGMSPFTLYPGSNITLTNVDLRPLFELQNLSGLNASQYAQTLPEGIYQFCFQAYDYYTKHNLSAKTCAQAYLTQYEPPLLNLPQNAEKVQVEGDIVGSKGIVFQWMPRQVAPNTHYIFILKELWDAGRSPVAGFLSSPILWKEKTYATSLYYGPEKTRLIPGKRYAWQVQAVSGNPVVGANPTEDNGVYKNNGLSEIFYFDYVEDCKVPTFLMAKNAGRGRVELSWTMPGQPSGLYSIQYRKRDSNTDWQTEESYQTKYILTGLENQTEYEYRIGTVCGNLQNFNPSPLEGETSGNAYAYSAIQYFTTDSEEKESSKYQCGVMPSIDLTNKAPLQTVLGTNEVFMAGDFPVTVISSQGSNGIYSGEGYIEVPYLGDTKIKVVFNNIKLNTDKQLIEGVVETTYDAQAVNIVSASEGIEDVIKVVKSIKEKVKKIITTKKVSSEDYKILQDENDHFVKEVKKQISFLAPILTDEELENYEKEIKELEKYLKESNCTAKNNENVNTGGKGGGYSMPISGLDELFLFLANEDCIEKVKKYEQSLERINNQLQKDTELYNELEEFWNFLKNCITQSKAKEDGYIPRFLWDHGYYMPNGPFGYYVFDPAFSSGFIDGAIGTVDGAVKFVDFISCMSVGSFRAWLDSSCYKTRRDFIETLRAVYEVLKDTERLKQATQAIKQQLSEYVGETANVSNQARYNQGKLTFDIVTLFVGVGEVKALLKGEKTVAQLFSKIGKLPKDAITEIRKIKKPKRGDAKRIFEKVRKGKAFETLVSSKIKNIPPFNTLYKDYKHLTQIHLKGRSKNIVADDLFVKQVRDNRGRTYFRAIISDSKLTRKSPWTPNQKSELINVFRDNPNKKFIEFEVRTNNTILKDLKSPEKFIQGVKVRIYREDVYKIISDGDNIKTPPIRMSDINFKN
ncbi:hypothetical protein MSHRCOH1_03815 [Candidatus Ornithobacterium hominis]|uniref:fibronectin type III domain-containing protein n=1 Tax=Candidatus Ornithobacterium hominis TaxID=2497989 RepID=UPI0024BBF697|nr:fibronectin type III domain-containing protein [Candidatus Ornithobacterium hominis]CAI9429317.1 hypothetical protein MSHRCOH1_03815 [Candidatus Ornithobacterium hominis]